jgi:hypothetical protein
MDQYRTHNYDTEELCHVGLVVVSAVFVHVPELKSDPTLKTYNIDEWHSSELHNDRVLGTTPPVAGTVVD